MKVQRFNLWIIQFLIIVHTISGFDEENNDGRRVCMNLLGKYEEIEPLDPHGASLAKFNIEGKHLFQTANLGDPCSLDLYVKYIKPIYEVTNRHDELNVISKLDKYLEEHPQLVRESCFGLTNSSRGRFYKCHKNESGVATCICMNEDPWLFRRVPKIMEESECQLIQSKIGDPCDFSRMKDFNRTLFQPHFEAMKKADFDARKTESALIHYGKSLIRNCQFEFSIGDIRSLCLGITTNLECKENNKCGCIDVEPFYQYTKKSGYCVAKRGSVCLFEPKTRDGTPILLRSAACADNLLCTAPVLQPEYAEFDFHAFQICSGSRKIPWSSLLSLSILFLLYHYSTVLPSFETLTMNTKLYNFIHMKSIKS